MGSITGNDGVIKLDGEKVIQARSWSIDETGDTAENTVIGSEARTFKKAMTSWSGSLEVFYDTEDIAVDDLAVGKEIDIQLYPNTDNPGALFYVGLAIITSLTNGASFDGMTERTISYQGTGLLIRANFMGAFAGNDDCDKPGDIPGECVEPDFRNPSERFEELTFQEGDFYTISDIVEDVPGHVNLVDEEDLIIRPIQVYNGETIALRTTTAPAGVEGWYLLQRDIIAADVSFDDSPTVIKGENVQEWNEAADAAIQERLAKTGGTMSGDLILNNTIGITGRNAEDTLLIEIARILANDAVALGTGLVLSDSEIQALLPLVCGNTITIPNSVNMMGRNAEDTENIIILGVMVNDSIRIGGAANSPLTTIRAAGVDGLQLSVSAIDSLLEHVISVGLTLRNNIALNTIDLDGTAYNILRMPPTNNLHLGVQSAVAGGSNHHVYQNGTIVEEITDTYHDHYRTPTHVRQDQNDVTGATTIDFTLGARFSIVCLGAAQLTLTPPTGSTRVCNCMLQITPGGNLVTFTDPIRWPDGVEPIIETGVWIMSLFWNGGAWYATAQLFDVV